VAAKRKTHARAAADKANGDTPGLQKANSPAAIATAITTINLTAKEIRSEISLPRSLAAQIVSLRHWTATTEIVTPAML
jgi:hypothetical protein